MKRSSAALALASSLVLIALPTVTLAMGSGGGGGGGMPSGGGMGPGSTEQPQFDPSAEFRNGENQLRAGNYKDAIGSFSRVVQAAPNSAVAWLLLGLAKSGVGDNKGAEAAFAKSVKIDGGSVKARRELAMTEIRLGQTDKANADLQALQKMAAKCGGACPDADDLKDAVGAVQTALSLPNAGSANAPGGAPPKPAASNAAPEHLSLATPEAGDGAYVRAVSLINERRWDDALTSLTAAEAALGPHPDILTYEGYVWRHKGDWARAEGYYREALSIAPNHRGATEYYGELKVLKGDIAGARAMLAKLETVCTYGCAEAEELRLWIDHGGDPAA